jgi:hypothetical protein
MNLLPGSRRDFRGDLETSGRATDHNAFARLRVLGEERLQMPRVPFRRGDLVNFFRVRLSDNGSIRSAIRQSSRIS